jgi:hypothetical protein
MTIRRLLPLSLVAMLALPGCPKEEEELRHGIVKLLFLRGEGEDASPFSGTAQVTITMEYRDCLIGYYDANMNMRQQGVDGELVFGSEELGGEGWLERLCELEIESMIDCTVEEFTQELDVGAPKLTVVYNVSGEMEGRQLPIGPFPDREEAACMGGALPEVRLIGARGHNADGTEVWRLQATGASADAVIDQGAAIEIAAERATG